MPLVSAAAWATWCRAVSDFDHKDYLDALANGEVDGIDYAPPGPVSEPTKEGLCQCNRVQRSCARKAAESAD